MFRKKTQMLLTLLLPGSKRVSTWPERVIEIQLNSSEKNCLSRFIRGSAKSKNMLSNLIQQLGFMYALMFHIRGISALIRAF